MLPIVLGALFWRGSTKWGALAVTLWTAGTVGATAVLQAVIAAPAAPMPVWTIGGLELITRTPGGTDVLGFMPVVPMTLISVLLMYGGVRRHPQAEQPDDRAVFLDVSDQAGGGDRSTVGHRHGLTRISVHVRLPVLIG